MINPESIGPYNILDKLGQGGMGIVYKARDKRLHRLVALKFLIDASQDPRVPRRFLREARTASSLNHPNIVAIYDIGEENGAAYIVMEYVDGKSLKQMIPPNGLPMALALAYATQIADGVAAAHAVGVIHRDLKPGNVMVNDRGQAKVLDFGLARFDSAAAEAEDADALPSITELGVFQGTAAYTSPEQSLGKQVDHRADIFSFGVMLFELLTGKRPFAGNNVVELLCAINTREPRGIRELCPNLPASLEAAVFRMLAKNPDERFQTMDSVSAVLETMRNASEAPAGNAVGQDPDATRYQGTETFEMSANAMPSASARPPIAPPPSGSEKTAIAVAPFRSLSTDKEDEYLAAGIASEVIRALSGIPGVRVASELTSYKFRNEAPDLQQIAESLKLRYVLTGSLRRAGNRIRVIAELSEAPLGVMVWSQTYNRVIEDVFEIQEDIAQAIVGATGGQIIKARGERASRESRQNLGAWELVNKANHFVNHAYNFQAIDEAIDLLRQAIAVAPEYAAAHSFLGLYLAQRMINGRSGDVQADREEAVAAVNHALKLAPGDPQVLENSGLVYVNCGKTELASRVLKRAVETAPFNLVAWGYLGLCLGWTGSAAEMAEAQLALDRLINNTPDHPSLPYWLYFKAGVCAREGDYQTAAACARRSAELQPRFTLALMEYANALGFLGRREEAAAAMGEVVAINPGATQELYMEALLTTTGSAKLAEPHFGGLVAAGLFRA